MAAQMWRGLTPTVDAPHPVELVEEEVERSNDFRIVRLHHAPVHAVAARDMTEDEEEGDEEEDGQWSGGWEWRL